MSPPYLSDAERIRITDGVRGGKSARTIAVRWGRAASTVTRELARNRAVDGSYDPHTAHALMSARRPRPKPYQLAVDGELRALVQGYLDQR